MNAPKITQRPPMVHVLKCDREHFIQVYRDNKKAEVRRADRDYQLNDILYLIEVFRGPADNELIYTGRTLWRRITHILRGGQYGIGEDTLVISMEVLDPPQPKAIT